MDESIRFAGMANKLGKIIMAEYRKGLISLLSKKESEFFIMQSAMVMGVRKTNEPKLGKTAYASAVYEKVKLITIPLSNDDDSYLMLLLDIQADHEYIVMKKIVSLLTKYRL